MVSQDKSLLLDIKTKICQLEALAFELQELGQGLPVVEKNSRIILSAAYVLKHGISDIADIDA